MSKQGDAIKLQLKKYVDAMRAQGKEPSALYLTKAQFDVLRAEAGGGPDWKPRLMGFEVKVAK
jgi:hypothetical protein